MRSFFIPVIFFTLIISVSSCGEYPCTKGNLRFNLIGFTDPEADTIILRRFTKNTSALIDTFFFDESDPVRFIRFSDTLIMVALPGTALLDSEHDYQIFFPATGTQFRIAEINEEQSYLKKGLFNTNKIGCVNTIFSYKLDGNVMRAIQFPDRIYLKK